MPDHSHKRLSDLVRLRDVRTDDLPILFRYQLDPEANRMAVTNPRDLEGFNAHWARIMSDSALIAKVITIDDVVVGSISCFKLDGLDAVGYWIGREYWGRGIATRALALLLDTVAVRPLHARAARTNVGSI